MDNVLFCMIAAPAAVGLLCLLIPARVRFVREFLGLVTTLGLLLFAILFLPDSPAAPGPWFVCDALSALTGIGVAFFSLVVMVYSVGWMKEKTRETGNRYYAYLLWTAAAGIGAACANHLVLLLTFWGFLGVTLYLLVNLGSRAAGPARKMFILVGGSDALLLFGIAAVWVLSGSLLLTEARVTADCGLAFAAFFAFLAAVLTKAGGMPFHTWIPDIAETAPAPVMAFLPASLDKLLGIYLLARMCTGLFVYHDMLWMLLRLLGAVTIVAAVMMALVQHNIKKLLSYHAVSQVGYMILGIASANPIGIAGGLFHMMNHAVYKCALFLGAGAVEKQTGTSEMDNLGGLYRFMPVTFGSFLIAALAISGIPPLNGFFSKWMVYRSLIEGAASGDITWIIWLIAAMIGSALTLASFMKVIHSVFLGHQKKYQAAVKEASAWMLLPGLVLAVVCVLFGVVYPLPVQLFLEKIVPGLPLAAAFSLVPSLVVILMALVAGLAGYFFVSLLKVRSVTSFVGGEEARPEMAMSGTDFYRTVEEERPFAGFYLGARRKFFDVYEIGRSVVGYFGRIIQIAHTGYLSTYLSWVLFGLIVLLVLFVGG